MIESGLLPDFSAAALAELAAGSIKSKTMYTPGGVLRCQIKPKPN